MNKVVYTFDLNIFQILVNDETPQNNYKHYYLFFEMDTLSVEETLPAYLIEVNVFKARLYSKESGKFFSLDYTKFCFIKGSEQDVTKVVSLRKFGSKCVCVRACVC